MSIRKNKRRLITLHTNVQTLEEHYAFQRTVLVFYKTVREDIASYVVLHSFSICCCCCFVYIICITRRVRHVYFFKEAALVTWWEMVIRRNAMTSCCYEHSRCLSLQNPTFYTSTFRLPGFSCLYSRFQLLPEIPLTECFTKLVQWLWWAVNKSLSFIS